VLLAAALSAQASTHHAVAIKGNLLWVQPLRNHPVHRVMQAGFLDECKKIHYHCEIVGNPSATTVDVPASVALAEAALSSKHFSGVGVYAFSPEMYPFALKVQKAGYPTVSWHILLKKGTKSGIDAITGCNPQAYAIQAAMAMGKKLGGTGKVAVTEGSFNTIENLVAKQFTATMHKSFPNITVLAPQIEGFEPSAAQAKAVSIIQANQDVSGAFSTTGGGPETWANAQRQTGHKLVIIAMDYVRQNLDLVKSGDVYAVVGQPLYQEGAKTADLLAAMAQHKKVPYYNFLPAPVITKAQTAHYYALLARAHQ
jgi:ribose transport system substrate-binding protein